MSLSKRVQHLAGGSSLQQKNLLRAKEDPYDRVENPSGFINLGIAENTMCTHMLLPALTPSVTVADLQYGPNSGSQRLRKAAAWLSSQTFGFEPDPEDLFVANGVTTINEMLAFCLCDPGDGILLASPFYPGFGLDFCLRAQATLLPVREAPATASGASEESGTELGGPLCVESLEIEYQKAIAEGVHPRLLCLCSPSNPTGRVYSADTLTEILQWALQKEDLHVYVDEIYALTTFVGETFTSVRTLPLLPHDRVHTGHGLAKDFGLSGLKTGWLYTTNEDMKSVLRQLLRFGVTSSLNQCAIASLLEDHELTLSYLQKVRQELTDARDFTKRSLEEISVKTVPSQAGLFLWVDMREHIQAIQHVKGLSSLADAELLLVEHLIEKEKLILLSSRACQAVEPGFFRLTFAFHDAEVLISEGVCRIGRALDTLKCPPI